MSASARPAARRMRGGGERAILALGACFAAAVLALTILLVLRWPSPPSAPDAPSLPISVGGVVFNIPPAAIRQARQRRAGAHGRLDLAFLWPTLAPPDPAAKPTASEELPAIDRLFVTIAEPEEGLGPIELIRNIYPRYFDFGRFAGPDGLLVIRFRDGTPYQGEDLFYDPAAPERFVVRCTRPGAGATPGTCLYERRLAEKVDVTVRFPRDWLSDWRTLSIGIEQMLAGLQARPPGS